ncbi:unnamed protein product [Oncorhynchus mykiss]|uniref:Uncharacterized protein n=1 Tax=Oncorhynchus mykiss TaxID=8022 RepID=A0A060WM31_ONCMY|nr:unnamed protein product [Oncorhynchus mykiss]
MLFNRSLPTCPSLLLWTVLTYEYVDNYNYYKYLGVWLDCKLSFQTHIKHLQSKITSRIGFLFSNKASFTHAAQHTLVKLTILPMHDFGDVIYKLASNILLSKLDAVYHSAVRFVTKASYTTHQCDLYALVGWPSLHICHQTHWLQVIYKSVLVKSPPYLSSLVTIAAPTRSTRSSRYISLVTPKANSSFGRLSFLFSAANDWKLQKSLKLETHIALTSFKHQLSEQLTDHTCT